MALNLLSLWSEEGFLLESKAEQEMSIILEGGPGTQARPLFACAPDWHTALKDVASDPSAVDRRRLVIFPQVSVAKYRTDFLVVAANVAPLMKRADLEKFAFFVEVDGKQGHVETEEQIIADLEREKAIRRITGLRVLRFSGAECMYQRNEVNAVLSAQVLAMAALREYGSTLADEAHDVLRAVKALSSHRASRRDYTFRNSSRSNLDPYDPYDPHGENDLPGEVIRECEWDEFLGLRVRLARLDQARSRFHRDEPYMEVYEPDGQLKPFTDVLDQVICNLGIGCGFRTVREPAEADDWC